MGLDMFLYARKNEFNSYAVWEQREGKEDTTNYPEDLQTMAEYIYERNFKSITTETSYQIGYFRKFNALHSFIVNRYADGVDECQPIELTKENIKEIIDICKKVAERHELAEKLLPTSTGFFFGGTEYDEYYFSDVDDAITLFNMILDNKLCDTYDIIYQASW